MKKDELNKQTLILIITVAVTIIVVYIIWIMARKQLLVAKAKKELEKWEGKTETDPSMHSTLVEYWNAAGFDWITEDNIQDYDNEYAWSAAFISYCVRSYYPHFPPSAAHANYTVAARERKKMLQTSFIAREPDDYAPKPGDIIVEGRSYSGDLEGLFKTAKTHGDIVIENTGTQIVAIGGNVGHTVKKRTFPANKGYLLTNHFAVVKM